jgi:hypothetical protein
MLAQGDAFDSDERDKLLLAGGQIFKARGTQGDIREAEAPSLFLRALTYL